MTDDLRLLLIDDDVELCGMLRSFCGSRGMEIECQHDGPRGLARALGAEHDLILLDVMVPRLDGFELLRQLRRRSAVPVLMLTARAECHQRVKGLDAGADDYVLKPFAPTELVARVRAVMRRSRVEAPITEVISAGAVTLCVTTRELTVDGFRIGLTARESAILRYLIGAEGRIVSRDELMNALGQLRVSPLERSVDVYVSRLRKKLGARTAFIRSIRGVGYLFIPTRAR